MLNYWWVTRPKRKLNSVPEVLSVFIGAALAKVWAGERANHLSLEEALEESGLKVKGERRDQTGGGARTYKAWLMSLGLIFEQQSTGRQFLTLAGEAIMNGESPVKILTNQVIKYQFPSAFSVGRGVQVHPRFRVHPFWFLLRLMMDSRIGWLSQDEIAKIIVTEAESDSEKCHEHIVMRLLEYRSFGSSCLVKDFCQKYRSSKGSRDTAVSSAHLDDLANTIINWLEYTQLIERDGKKIYIWEERRSEVARIVASPLPLISVPENKEVFQRKYGLDCVHRKDTRNMNETQTVSSYRMAEHQVRDAFINISLKMPIVSVDATLVNMICERTGMRRQIVQKVLEETYPHGSIGAFMTEYREMAFRGKEYCREFEEATAKIFQCIFGFETHWLGSKSSGKEVPDVLLISEEAGFQAIIDNKAYSKYTLTSTDRDRMIHHYLPDIHTYSDCQLPTAFFTYVAGGFSNNFASPIRRVSEESRVPGSGISVYTFSKMMERQIERPYSHEELRKIFSVNRCVQLEDL